MGHIYFKFCTYDSLSVYKYFAMLRFVIKPFTAQQEHSMETATSPWATWENDQSESEWNGFLSPKYHFKAFIISWLWIAFNIKAQV